jgi:hypothetical protein
MKNVVIFLLPIIILAAFVNSYKSFEDNIPYCKSKNDYNCQVKIKDVETWYETFGDLSNSYWYQIKEQRWQNIDGEHKLVNDVTLIQLPQQIKSKKELLEI